MKKYEDLIISLLCLEADMDAKYEKSLEKKLEKVYRAVLDKDYKKADRLLKPLQKGGAWLIDADTGERVLIEDDVLRTAPMRQGVYVVFDQRGRARRVRTDQGVPRTSIQYGPLPSSPQILAITSHKNYVPAQLLATFGSDYRKASEEYLRQHPNMIYVLRPSSQEGTYVLSYLKDGWILHTQFTIENGIFCYIVSNDKKICSDDLDTMIKLVLKPC